MNDSNDRELRDLFRRLKDSDVGSAPAFGQLLAGARRRPPARASWRLALAVGASVLVAVASYSIARPGRGDPFGIPGLETPTDFLLDTPGRGFLTSVPRLTTVAPVPGAAEEESQP